MGKALEISLIITAIHVSMWDSMIFAKIRLYLQRLPSWTHKPLFECLICMGGIYSIVLMFILYQHIDFIIMLQVIGLNTIISALIQRLND